MTLRRSPRKRWFDGGAAADVVSAHRFQEAAMATEQQQTVDAGTAIDREAFAATVQMYIDGSAQGDTAMLTEAFHPDAQMYGAVGEDRYDEPITEYVKLVGDSPGGETMRARITSIVQAGDAATATVVEDGFSGACPSSPSSSWPASTAAGASSTRTSRTPGESCPQKRKRGAPHLGSSARRAGRSNRARTPPCAERKSRGGTSECWWQADAAVRARRPCLLRCM